MNPNIFSSPVKESARETKCRCERRAYGGLEFLCRIRRKINPIGETVIARLVRLRRRIARQLSYFTRFLIRESRSSFQAESRLFILDVGHGNCAVLIAEGAKQTEVLVVDVGRRGTLLEFLNQQDIKRIRTVYISHADADHIGGLVGLLAEDIAIDRILLNSDALKESRIWEDLVYELDSAHRKGALEFCVGLVSGSREELGEICIEVLGPSRSLVAMGVGNKDRSSRKIHSNSISAVIRISVSGKPVVVLPADIDGVGLDDLLEKGTDLMAPIVVYPHHGGRLKGTTIASFAAKFLNAVFPEIVVFSIGRGKYGTPDPSTVQAVKEIVPNARIMCTQLSERCSKSVYDSSQLTHLSDAFSAGQFTGQIGCSCCAGTIVIPLRDLQNLEPSESSHLEFIRSRVASPLCLKDPNSGGSGSMN